MATYLIIICMSFARIFIDVLKRNADQSNAIIFRRQLQRSIVHSYAITVFSTYINDKLLGALVEANLVGLISAFTSAAIELLSERLLELLNRPAERVTASGTEEFLANYFLWGIVLTGSCIFINDLLSYL